MDAFTVEGELLEEEESESMRLESMLLFREWRWW